MTKRLFLVATCILAFVLTYTWEARPQTQPSGKALLEAYVSAWNRRDFAALDNLLAPDAVHEDMARPSRDVGAAQFIRSIRASLEAQHDLNWHVTSIVDGGSVVAAEWVWSGTYTDDSHAGPGVARSVSGRGVSVLVMENGRIKRFSDYYDFASVFH